MSTCYLHQVTLSALGNVMKGLAGRMTQYRNKLEGRSGTLWESRYKSSVVQTDTYLLSCSRYIELNPVRTQMVQRAQDYPWSSLQLRLKGALEGSPSPAQLTGKEIDGDGSNKSAPFFPQVTVT